MEWDGRKHHSSFHVASLLRQGQGRAKASSSSSVLISAWKNVLTLIRVKEKRGNQTGGKGGRAGERRYHHHHHRRCVLFWSNVHHVFVLLLLLLLFSSNAYRCRVKSMGWWTGGGMGASLSLSLTRSLRAFVFVTPRPSFHSVATTDGNKGACNLIQSKQDVASSPTYSPPPSPCFPLQ